MKTSKNNRKMIKTVLTAVIAPAILLAMFGSAGCAKTGAHPVCEIVVKDFGTITVTLNGEEAPITVEHFVKLAKEGSFDGSVINRIQAGFVLQGGAGAKDDSTIKGEFKSNGVNNNILHKKGVISMARAQDPDSASSQFFIMLDDNSTLDGDYAAFGEVTDGWDTVEKICASVNADDFREDYYGVMMGFLKDENYITIETVRVISD
ncbi:MAG: peptidylprolyl isomerase [Clostridia bacterium]|nr:peptidylprolyl isomerase [Clostridia bacterium]